MTEEIIKRLEDLGFKRWEKNGLDRLYINAKDIGLECDYYKTGNVHYATFRGEHISNTRAREMLCSKTFVDVKTGKVHSDNNTMRETVTEILENI